jgi:predicted  nucleic acid-binding Zn-ribbon protein
MHVQNIRGDKQSTLKSTYYLLLRMVKSIDKREYDELDSLSSSANTEISRLSVIAKNLLDRLESLERNQTEMMDKLNDLEKKIK